MTWRARTWYRPDILAVVALIILWLLFFWRLYTPTTSDKLIIQQGDFSGQYYNFSAYQASRFSTGTLIPAWNPFNYAGSPFLADPQAEAAYPVRWLFLTLFRGQWSYGALEAEVAFHFLLTSLLLYAFARQLSGKAIGGMIAAIAFTYGGYLNSFPIQQVTILESGTWLPLVLLAIHRGTLGTLRRNWGWFVVAGIGMGLIFVAGHPQVAMLCGYFAAAYLAFRVFMGGSRRWRDLIIGGALFAGIGVGLAAIMLLPTAELQQWATRATDLDYAGKSGGYPFADVLQILWSTATNLFAPLYIGVVGLALAVIAVIYRRSQATFWVVAGVTALALGFGGKTALFQFAYTLLPGISLFRDQERASLIWSLCASILAGIGAVGVVEGLDGQAQRRVRYGLYALFGLTFAYLLLLYSGAAGNTGTALERVAFTMIVTGATAVLLPWVIQRPVTRQLALVGLLVFDLFSMTQGGPAFAAGVPETTLPEASWMATMRPLLAADPFARIDGTDKLGVFGSLFSLPAVRGTSPLHLAGTERLLNLPAAKYWDLLAVRYVVSGDASLPVPAQKIQDVNDWSGKYSVYELQDPRPLATLIYSADVMPNDDYAAQLIAAPDFPVRDKVILPQPSPLTLVGQKPADSSVTLLDMTTEHLHLRATTSADALLLISMPYYPGWKATANGQAIPTIRADLGLIAVPLPAGNYDVSLDFRPTSIQVGGIVSVVTLLLTLIALVGWVVQRRRNGENRAGHRPAP